VFRREIDDCVAAAISLAESCEPGEALDRWVQRYTAFAATKHGLAAALHSGDPAYSGLRDYFECQAGPALQTLLGNAEHAGVIAAGADPRDLLGAIANLCVPPPASTDRSHADRMVALLLKGLRYGAPGRTTQGDAATRVHPVAGNTP
jgi:Transcriptional regulator SbtR-like, C-terminal domain